MPPIRNTVAASTNASPRPHPAIVAVLRNTTSRMRSTKPTHIRFRITAEKKFARNSISRISELVKNVRYTRQ